MGRANAGKTTILEKVCGVARATKTIIYDKDGNRIKQSVNHLMPSLEMYPLTCNDNREACMILSIKSHTLG
ncbi:hypothetical protein AX14_008831, partial [Amanita brunnescens Koide BX004]